LRAPISKKPITKRVGGEAQGEGPEFKPQHQKKKKKKKEKGKKERKTTILRVDSTVVLAVCSSLHPTGISPGQVDSCLSPPC
jgi:hypothetical protein